MRSPPTSTAAVPDRFRGCLLGLAVGDGIGAPYEALTSFDVFHLAGEPARFMTNPEGRTLFYTDDTEMALGVAESLVEHGEIRVDELAHTFARNYHPDRGYGPGARRILDAVIEKRDWNAVADSVYPGGSLGNGAAMRVAPVGLLFHADLDRVREQAALSARPTHRHPVGIEAAQVLAHAVAVAVRSAEFDRKRLFAELLARARTEEIRWALETAAALRFRDSLSVLGSTLEAHRSVVTAIAAFARFPNDFVAAVGTAIALGDDTDTLAAMTGALCGAFGGTAAVPAALVEKLETQDRGPTEIVALADALAARLG